jgi:hypothetical protein
MRKLSLQRQMSLGIVHEAQLLKLKVYRFHAMLE